MLKVMSQGPIRGVQHRDTLIEQSPRSSNRNSAEQKVGSAIYLLVHWSVFKASYLLLIIMLGNTDTWTTIISFDVTIVVCS